MKNKILDLALAFFLVSAFLVWGYIYISTTGDGQSVTIMKGEKATKADKSREIGDNRDNVAVNLISKKRLNHILYGDATGGGHLWPGGPGKSPFPQNWSKEKIIKVISEIAKNPSIEATLQSNGRVVKNATIDGIDVRVVLEPPEEGGWVVTAFPTNTRRN